MATIGQKVDAVIGTVEHQIKQSEHETKANIDSNTMKNPNAPVGDRVAAAVTGAGHSVAGAYHSAAKETDINIVKHG